MVNFSTERNIKVLQIDATKGSQKRKKEISDNHLPPQSNSNLWVGCWHFFLSFTSFQKKKASSNITRSYIYIYIYMWCRCLDHKIAYGCATEQIFYIALADSSYFSCEEFSVWSFFLHLFVKFFYFYWEVQEFELSSYILKQKNCFIIWFFFVENYVFHQRCSSSKVGEFANGTEQIVISS